jgi:hypothetical protein
MDAEPLPLPLEISQALAANGGASPLFEDPETFEVYRLVKEPVEITLDDEYIHQEVAKGLADIEAGRVEPWDVEAFLAKMHRRLEEENRG